MTATTNVSSFVLRPEMLANATAGRATISRSFVEIVRRSPTGETMDPEVTIGNEEDTTERTCTNCGRRGVWEDARDLVDERWHGICPECFAKMRRCERCELWDWQYDMWRVGRGRVCGTCIRKYYRQCRSCGNYFLSDEGVEYGGGVYCDDRCYRNHNHPIHEFDYRPEPVFYGRPKDGLYMGVELEFEAPAKTETAWYLFEEYSNKEELFYLKADSSINHGFELVTHPCSLKYHKDVFAWPAILKYLVSVKCQSFHAESSCGVHIHVSRDAFSNAEQIRLAYFMNRHQRNWETLAQRTSNQWSAFKDKQLNEEAIYGDDRYEVVNYNNDDTLEFRMFKGTLKLETFMAYLELTETICRFVQSYNNTDIVDDTLAWDDFMAFAKATGYKYLAAYLVRKGF